MAWVWPPAGDVGPRTQARAVPLERYRPPVGEAYALAGPVEPRIAAQGQGMGLQAGELAVLSVHLFLYLCDLFVGELCEAPLRGEVGAYRFPLLGQTGDGALALPSWYS